jgi:hypothetical protein
MRIPHWRTPMGRRDMPDIFNWGWGPALASIIGFFVVLYLSNRFLGIDDHDWRFVLVLLLYWGPVIGLGWKSIDRADHDDLTD